MGKSYYTNSRIGDLVYIILDSQFTEAKVIGIEIVEDDMGESITYVLEINPNKVIRRNEKSVGTSTFSLYQRLDAQAIRYCESGEPTDSDKEPSNE